MAQPLTDAINALTRYANEVTGQSDPDLSSAVRTLCDGYGGGGDDLSVKMVDGSITEYVDDSITYIRAGAFANCYDFGKFICHNVTTVQGNFLSDNRSESAMTPLVSVAFPKLATVGNYGMQGNHRMGKLDLTICSSLGNRCFENCYWLTVLILRRNEVVSLSNIANFNNTPFRGRNNRTADLFVPSALISEYENATNWSTILANGYTTIHAIEGSEYEHYYADGTPIE